MKVSFFRWISGLIILGLLLGGCGPGGAPATAVSSPVDLPSATPLQPTATTVPVVFPSPSLPGATAVTASAPAPTLLPTSTAFATDLPPVVGAQELDALPPVALQLAAAAPLIILGEWSPGGVYLPLYTFTQDQVEALNLIPEGPVAYPPVTLHFLEAASGRICDYPRPVLVGQGSLAWLPQGQVVVQEESGWMHGRPCEEAFQSVAGAQSLAGYFPDPGLSPDGAWVASRFFDIREGIVYNELTFTDTATDEALQTVQYQEEERIGSWAEAGPGGAWLDNEAFLIPETFDQGPLLVLSGQRVVQVLPELFGEEFQPCTPQACRLYQAYGATGPAGARHILLSTQDMSSGARSLRLYHAEDEKVETLNLAAAWPQAFSPSGNWLLLDQDGNYRSLWFRPVDPPGSPVQLFVDDLRGLAWSPEDGRIAVTGPGEDQVRLLTFPQGELVGAWSTPGYPYTSLASWSPQGDFLAVYGYGHGEQESALFLLDLSGLRQ